MNRKKNGPLGPDSYNFPELSEPRYHIRKHALLDRDVELYLYHTCF